MFNQAFGTDQFQGVTQTYGEIFPSWFDKTFTTFFSWIPNLTVPDARADLAAAFKTDAAGNYWSVSEPDEIDAKLDAAFQEFDFETANGLVREVQDFIIENGQFGRHIIYNAVSPTVAAGRSPVGSDALRARTSRRSERIALRTSASSYRCLCSGDGSCAVGGRVGRQRNGSRESERLRTGGSTQIRTLASKQYRRWLELRQTPSQGTSAIVNSTLPDVVELGGPGWIRTSDRAVMSRLL